MGWATAGRGEPAALEQNTVVPCRSGFDGPTPWCCRGPFVLVVAATLTFVCRLTCMVILLPLSFDLAPVICMISC